jgi:FixJ family two-component response regulator
MLPSSRDRRDHSFLLVTPCLQPHSIGAARFIGHVEDFMAEGPSWSIVAVVDDDESVLRSLEYLLESADYAVRLFASGRELLDSGCLPTIDCLISDIDMPGMEGFELLRQIHAARPGLPVIFITGYPDTLKRFPGSAGSIPRFFTKPFQGPELLAAISEAISRVSTSRR